MSRSRYRRITLRFYLDDPEACALYDQLQQYRRETGTPMSTLTMEALKARFMSGTHLADDQNDALRELLRTEIRAALREWSPAMPTRETEAVASASEPNGVEEDEYDLNSIEAALGFSL